MSTEPTLPQAGQWFSYCDNVAHWYALAVCPNGTIYARYGGPYGGQLTVFSGTELKDVKGGPRPAEFLDEPKEGDQP